MEPKLCNQKDSQRFILPSCLNVSYLYFIYLFHQLRASCWWLSGVLSLLSNKSQNSLKSESVAIIIFNSPIRFCLSTDFWSIFTQIKKVLNALKSIKWILIFPSLPVIFRFLKMYEVIKRSIAIQLFTLACSGLWNSISSYKLD